MEWASSAVLGGVLWLLLVPLITLTYPGRTKWASVETIFSLAWEDYNELLPIVLLLLLGGLTGLTAKHGQRSGGLGRAGLVVALFGLGLMLLGNITRLHTLVTEGSRSTTLTRQVSWVGG